MVTRNFHVQFSLRSSPTSTGASLAALFGQVIIKQAKNFILLVCLKLDLLTPKDETLNSKLSKNHQVIIMITHSLKFIEQSY